MLSVPPKTTPDGDLQLHATTIAIEDRGLVIAGPSGSGKSGLALRLMALGARLVADDVTWITAHSDILVAHCPAPIASRIEARGLGVLQAETSPAPVTAILDLGQMEQNRLPTPRTISILGQDVVLLHKSETPYFAEAVFHYMRWGRVD